MYKPIEEFIKKKKKYVTHDNGTTHWIDPWPQYMYQTGKPNHEGQVHEHQLTVAEGSFTVAFIYCPIQGKRHKFLQISYFSSPSNTGCTEAATFSHRVMQQKQ